MASEFKISLLQETDINPFLDHIERLLNESGDGHTPIFMLPSEGPFQRKSEKFLNLWKTGTHEEKWRRHWGAWHSEKIIGNFEIIGSGGSASRHRVIASIAIEAPYRRQGLGHDLVEAGIAWVRSHDFIEWIDFSVFSKNIPSLEFCRSYGFQETGFVSDAFRIADQKIDTINMTYNLKK